MAAAAGSWTVPVATMGGKGLWNTIAETELFLVRMHARTHYERSGN
jgi:hypothetical protein